jgi:hypothetical protein
MLVASTVGARSMSTSQRVSRGFHRLGLFLAAIILLVGGRNFPYRDRLPLYSPYRPLECIVCIHLPCKPRLCVIC